MVAVAPSPQVTDLAKTHRCHSLPLMSTRDVNLPFQSTGHSGSAATSTSLSSVIESASNSSTRRRGRRSECRGEEQGTLVASDMESADLFSRPRMGQPVERVALWRRLDQASPTQRALVLETRARMVGAVEGAFKAQ